jgi:RHH-type transcriptional regulator, rel operon repressor / antitoxin RelB
MERINVTCRLSADEVAFIDAMAKATERDRSYFIKKAVSNFVLSQREMLEEIDKAIADADAGHFATKEQVNETFSKLGA